MIDDKTPWDATFKIDPELRRRQDKILREQILEERSTTYSDYTDAEISRMLTLLGDF